jgi:hypothetical protein
MYDTGTSDAGDINIAVLLPVFGLQDENPLRRLRGAAREKRPKQYCISHTFIFWVSHIPI